VSETLTVGLRIADYRRRPASSLARGAPWMLKLGSIADLAVALTCLLVLSHTAYFTWMYFSSTRYWDFWNWIADYRDYVAGHYSLHELVKPHNEHRIVTTRLVLFADAILFHMTGRFVVVLNLLLLAVLGWALNLLARTPLCDGIARRRAGHRHDRADGIHVPMVQPAAAVSDPVCAAERCDGGGGRGCREGHRRRYDARDGRGVGDAGGVVLFHSLIFGGGGFAGITLAAAAVLAAW
jgi:hypothetical protein